MKTRRIRRGGKNGRYKNFLNFKTCEEWNIYHCNVRGYDSKRVSLQTILETVRPNVVTLNETHYVNKKKVNIDGYTVYNKNRNNMNGGGVATAIISADAKYALKVKEGIEGDEFLVTKHTQFAVPINVINVYGEVESRAKNKDIEDRWYRIVSELKKIEVLGEHVVFIGDMNKHVGEIIKGNHSKVSYGGKLIRELLNTKKYVLLNSTNKVQGGPYTRYNPTNPEDHESKSCLDLVIISRELYKYVDKVIIDKEQNFTPGNPSVAGKMVYPDHYALIIKMKNIPLASNKKLSSPKFQTWNLNKEGGWLKFHELTDDNSKLKNLINNNEDDPTILMKEIDKELEKAKFKAFDKVTVRNELKNNKEFMKLRYEREQLIKEDKKENEKQIVAIDNKMTSKILSKQREYLEKELKQLKEMRNNKGKAAAIFNLKDKVTGKKKSGQEAITMKHPGSNEVLSNKNEIKKAALNYCVDLLDNRKPKVGFEEEIKMKELIHDIRMEENMENDVEFTSDMFDNSLKILKKKNKEKYRFILQGGADLKLALFKLFNIVWCSEKKPDQWRKTDIIQLYKGKGDKDDFGSQRNIHTKNEISKFFGHIVMSKTKNIILNSMTKYQIGTKTGHRAQEHLFTLKSIIALYLKLDMPVFIQLYDISKFFDRESLRDGMNSLYSLGVRGKLYRLLFNMNKDTVIKVKTAVGDSEEKETGENIGQGTLEGANISAANIDYTVNQYFKNSKDEISYGVERLQPLLFQDDISRISTSIEAAQAGNDKMESVMESKLLDFNHDKSVIIVMGSKKRKSDIENQLKSSPLTLGGKAMKIATLEKYLGDMISTDGLADSVSATVMKRKGQTVSSIIETKAVIEDCRANVIGGIIAGLEIWELAILPHLLYNSETWTNISKRTVEILENIQYMFMRYLLATPRTCPIPSLLWETGGMFMELRIHKKKLLFLHHLLNLPEKSLAKEIANTQIKFQYPGLITECETLMKKYNLPAVYNYTKVEWKKIVERKLKEHNKKTLLIRMKNYKKLDYRELEKEEFKTKPYLKKLNLADARLKFALRTHMTRMVQANYKGDPKYKSNDWKCKECKVLDTQEHIVRCPTYKSLREDKDLSNDKDLIDYFRKVIDIRSKDD